MSHHAYDLRAHSLTIESQSLGLAKRLFVYIPPDLAGQRVPSLYLLRGHEREWINGHEDATRGGTTIIDVYERLRAAGTIGPMVLVFPGLSSDDNHVPGLIVNMRAPELVSHTAGIGRGQFADYFYNELIPFVDANAPTIASGRHRGIAGFSLGGAMAIKAAAERPDLFSSAGAYDGTFLYATRDGQGIKASDRVIQRPMFDAAFGRPRDMEFIASQNAANLILRAQPHHLRHISWIVGYGPRSAEPWQSNYYRGEHLVRCLRARGLPNKLHPGAWPDGMHTWQIADAFMAATLPHHDTALRVNGA